MLASTDQGNPVSAISSINRLLMAAFFLEENKHIAHIQNALGNIADALLNLLNVITDKELSKD